MVEEGQKRPRGGQTKPPLERKRNNLTFRARDRLKQDLEAVAAKNARSLSEEIEARLEQSFADDKALGGPEMARALRSFGPYVLAAEAKTGQRWFEDDETYTKVLEAFQEALIWHAALFPKSTSFKARKKRREGSV